MAQWAVIKHLINDKRKSWTWCRKALTFSSSSRFSSQQIWICSVNKVNGFFYELSLEVCFYVSTLYQTSGQRIQRISRGAGAEEKIYREKTWNLMPTSLMYKLGTTECKSHTHTSQGFITSCLFIVAVPSISGIWHAHKKSFHRAPPPLFILLLLLILSWLSHFLLILQWGSPLRRGWTRFLIYFYFSYQLQPIWKKSFWLVAMTSGADINLFIST